MRYRLIAGTAVAAAALALAFAGCAPSESPALRRAGLDYDRASNDPLLLRDAPVKLHEAGQTLERAEATWKKSHDPDEARHQAYLVERRIDIARATAAAKAASTSSGKTSETAVQ
jgi:hypothetical protein